MTSESGLREAVVAACRRLHAGGLIAGTAGNVSVRAPEGWVLVTPAGTRKDELAPVDLVRVDPDAPGANDPRPDLPAAPDGATTEWPLHRRCYAADPGCGAVAHAHAPALTALGLRGRTFADDLPEAAEAVGGVRLVPYAPTGSEALGAAVAEALVAGAGVLLLERHGAVAVAPGLDAAVDRMELAELSARAVLLAWEPSGPPSSGSGR